MKYKEITVLKILKKISENIEKDFRSRQCSLRWKLEACFCCGTLSWRALY